MTRKEKQELRVELQRRALSCREGLYAIGAQYADLLREGWLALFGEELTNEGIRPIRYVLNGSVKVGRDEAMVEKLEAVLRYHKALRENSIQAALIALSKGEA